MKLNVMKLAMTVVIGLLSTQALQAKPGAELFSVGTVATSAVSPALGALAVIVLVVTECNHKAEDSRGFGACLISPSASSSKEERLARIQAINQELVKVIAGEEQIHSVAVALVNRKLEESTVQLSPEQAAASLFRMFHAEELKLK